MREFFERIFLQSQNVTREKLPKKTCAKNVDEIDTLWYNLTTLNRNDKNDKAGNPVYENF